MQGYMVGNGVTDKKFDGNALVPFAHGMGLIPDNLYEVNFNLAFHFCQKEDCRCFKRSDCVL